MFDLNELDDLSELILANIHKIEDSEYAQKIIDHSDNINIGHKPLFMACSAFFKEHGRYPKYEYLNEIEPFVIPEKEFSLDLAFEFENRIHRTNVQIEAQQALQLGEFEEVERLLATVKRDKKSWTMMGDWKFETKKREWLVEDAMPQGRVVYLAGRGNIGKSRLSLQLACAVAMGRPEWLEGGPLLGTKGPRSVVYVSYEDTKTDIKKLLSYSDTFSDGNVYHGDTNHVFGGSSAYFKVLGQATKSPQPSKRSFDDPAFGHHLEPLGWLIGYIQPQSQQVFDEFDSGASVSLVATERLYRIILFGDLVADIPSLAGIGEIGRMDLDSEHIT